MTNHAAAATVAGNASFQATPRFQSADIGKAFKRHLEIRAGIVRVYPVRLPQTPVYPCVTFQVITEPREHTMEGAAAPNPQIQVDCWAETYLEAHAMATAIEQTTDGFVGRMGGVLQVSGCLQQEKQDFYEPDVDDYRVSLRYSIWHN